MSQPAVFRSFPPFGPWDLFWIWILVLAKIALATKLRCAPQIMAVDMEYWKVFCLKQISRFRWRTRTACVFLEGCQSVILRIINRICLWRNVF